MIKERRRTKSKEIGREADRTGFLKKGERSYMGICK